jgi:uncharacterized membrane protein YvbJ
LKKKKKKKKGRKLAKTRERKEIKKKKVILFSFVCIFILFEIFKKKNFKFQISNLKIQKFTQKKEEKTGIDQ